DQVVVYDPQCDEMPSKIYLVVCYVEKCCRPKDISCSPDDAGDRFQTRSRDGFEIKLYDELPECACSCEPAVIPEEDSKDGCCGGDDKNKTKDEAKPGEKASSESAEENKCLCYAAHNKGVCECECGGCVLIATIEPGIALDPPKTGVKACCCSRRR